MLIYLSIERETQQNTEIEKYQKDIAGYKSEIARLQDQVRQLQVRSLKVCANVTYLFVFNNQLTVLWFVLLCGYCIAFDAEDDELVKVTKKHG